VAAHDTHAVLDGKSWSAHATGRLDDGCRQALEAAGFPVHLWPDDAAMRKAGYLAGALYLVRPDGYVGLADPGPGTRAVEAYLSRHGIVLGPSPARIEVQP
jgi:hypothetical protein